VRSETKAICSIIFEEWVQSNRLDIGDADEELQYAYAIAAFSRMETAARRSGVQSQLWDWLDGRAMRASNALLNESE
jgi:hypothetical protein